MFFYLIAFLIAALDQFLKLLVQKFLLPGQSLPLLGKLVKLTYVRNSGAAFSFLVGYSPYLIAVGLAVCAVIIYFHYRVPAGNRYLQTALAFILGGSLGNILDRIFHFYVIDYLDITVLPVFNLADTMINTGVALIALYILFASREGKKDASAPV
jgi:signal peptidase II